MYILKSPKKSLSDVLSVLYCLPDHLGKTNILDKRNMSVFIKVIRVYNL